MAATQKYRLIGGLPLRIPRGPGKPDRVVARPRDERTKQFADSDDTPTLVTFEDGDQVDIEFLLNIGSIVPYNAPAKAEVKRIEKEQAANGEDRR